MDGLTDAWARLVSRKQGVQKKNGLRALDSRDCAKQTIQRYYCFASGGLFFPFIILVFQMTSSLHV